MLVLDFAARQLSDTAESEFSKLFNTSLSVFLSLLSRNLETVVLCAHVCHKAPCRIPFGRVRDSGLVLEFRGTWGTARDTGLLAIFSIAFCTLSP